MAFLLYFSDDETNLQSSSDSDEELKNVQRKEKKQLSKVKKLIKSRKDLVNKSIEKKMKIMKTT